MSQENVEIVRESWDAWLRGDLDGVLATYAPDVIWDLTHDREWPDAVYLGPAGARRIVAPDGRRVALVWPARGACCNPFAIEP
jgi:ketosteroid isomerase-like protein